MRVRPFFWLLLVSTCIGVTIFAMLYRPQLPAVLHIYVEHTHSVAAGPVVLDLHLADSEGSPIDEARVQPKAYMTNMVMPPTGANVEAHGNGDYKVRINVTMEGPWAINVQAWADGFKTQQQTLFVQVE